MSEKRLSLEALQSEIEEFLTGVELITGTISDSTREDLSWRIQELFEDLYPDFDYNYN